MDINLLNGNDYSAINICMAFDDHYFYHGMSTIKSLLVNYHGKNNINIFILCSENLCFENREILVQEFKNALNFKFINVDEAIFHNFPLNRNHINISTYFRLVIDQLLTEVDRVIYLDADIIVCGNILELWNADLNGNLIGGCLDEGGITQAKRLGISSIINYINAGVLVLDLAKIRYKYPNIFSTYCQAFIKNKENITLQDQDIINIVHCEEIQILDLRWNINSRFFHENELERIYSKDDEIAALSNIGIFHFTDRSKPWTFFCSHPYAFLYWKYRGLVSTKGLNLKDYFIKLNINYIRLFYRSNQRYSEFSVLGLRISIKKSILNFLLGRK